MLVWIMPKDSPLPDRGGGVREGRAPGVRPRRAGARGPLVPRLDGRRPGPPPGRSAPLPRARPARTTHGPGRPRRPHPPRGPRRPGRADRLVRAGRPGAGRALRRAGAGHVGLDLVGGADHGVLAPDAADRAGRAPLGRRIRDRHRGPPRPGRGRGRRDPDDRGDGPGPPRLAAGAAGHGERYRFRRTDGPESWTVVFSGDQVLLEPGSTGPADVEASGTASDLALFLWRRLPPSALQVTGDAALLPYWFTLVPPI